MLAVWRPGHPLWLAPHRPFFLLAGFWAVLVPIVWLVPEGLGPEPISWHRHELLFGMGGAAVGGYLLTALPAWTKGAAPPAVTRLLVALWIAGRLAVAIGPHPILAAIAEGSYFLGLGGFLSLAVFNARAWERTPLAIAPILLGLFALLSTSDLGLAEGRGIMRALPLVYALLISLIGGRMLAAFTMHWSRRYQPEVRVADASRIGQGAILALGVALVLLLAEADAAVGPLLILSGLLQLLRMLSWRSWRTARYPALLLLHLAWLWLALGLAITGISLLPSNPLDAAAGLHALTMGAMGTMMLAIMARAAMARRDTRLSVSLPLAVAFASVFLSAPIRLSASFAGEYGQPLALQLSAMVWCCGWMLFLWSFRPVLQGPVQRPVLSARISDAPSDEET